MSRATIFVGFTGEEFTRACRVWGEPDIVSRFADRRMFADVAPGDTVIFANGEEANKARRFRRPSFNDSTHFEGQ